MGEPVRRAWPPGFPHVSENGDPALRETRSEKGNKQEEIVAQENGTGQSWYEVKDKSWVKHVVSDRSYGHGIGAGDVNKDGRNDILTPRGWLEAPADPSSAGCEWPRKQAAWPAPGARRGTRRCCCARRA